MPISGHKELGANALARQSSDSISGVPIKKRRFPFIRPSSPPPSQIVEPVSEQKEQFNLKSESSSLNEGSPTEVSRVSTDIPGSSQEENREHSADGNVKSVQSNIDPPKSSLQESAIQIPSGSRSQMCRKRKVMVSDKTGSQMTVGGTKLQLPPNKALVQKVEEEMRNERKPSQNDNSNILKNAINTELVLARNGSSVSDLAGQDSGGICKEEKLDPCSLKLALIEKQSSSGSNHNNAESKISHNRSHWDLNTTMETWEGSMNHSAIGHEAGKCGMEHVIRSNKTVFSESEGARVTSGKQILEQSEHSSKLLTLSAPPDQQHKSEVHLHLCLSTSSGLQSGLGPEPSYTSPKVDSGSVRSNNLNFSQNQVSPSSNLNLALSKVVKSEPSDESNKQDFQGAKASPLKPVEVTKVKSEPCVVGYLEESHKSDNIGNLKLMDHGAVKSEPICGVNQETLGLSEGKSRELELYTYTAAMPLSGEVLPQLDVPIRSMALPIISHPLMSSTTLGLSSGAEASNHSEIPTSDMPFSGGEVAQEASQIEGASDLGSEPACPDGKESNVADVMSGIERAEGFDVTVPESSRLKSRDKLHLDSDANTDVAESDAEKINIFDDIHDDCSSDTDEESDGNHAGDGVMDSKDKHHGSEDDDYEDGEVREPLVHSAIEGSVSLDKEIDNHGISNSREVTAFGCPLDDHVTTSTSTHVEDRDAWVENPGELTSPYGGGECKNIQLSNKEDPCISEVSCLQESLIIEMPTSGTGKMEFIKAPQRGLLDPTGREEGSNGCEDELVSSEAVSVSQRISAGDDQGSIVSQQESVKGTSPEETKCSVWSKTEPLVNGAEATKDVNSKGNQSRIINLARAFSGPSTGKTKSFSGRFLPSQIEREGFNDVLKGDKFHPRGNRDDSFIDEGHKYERQRNQDQPGSDFMHGRGRTDKRLASPRSGWDSDHNFAPDNFNCRTTYRFSGPKNAAALMVARDGSIIGASRKPLSDELQNFRHPPSRRRSPGGRGVPVSHGMQIVRRPARDISPDRCIGRGDQNLIGLRQEKKFLRGLPDEMMDSVFSRPQPQYQQVDVPFVRGDRSFSPIQRRGPIHMPRIRSKSPSRTRSPGPWSSPRRRSPDGFGRPEMIHHRRSPPFYRVGRIRSPHQRPCFAEDVVGRRRGSPPYMTRLSSDMREMGASREHDHARSFMPNRSPSGRVLSRGTRRFNMIERRERMDSDEYFAGPMHSDRFHELGGDGGADGRRICGDRRRSFRPPYDAADVENFHFHVEGGPRPCRLSPEADAEFHERNNLREREFERHVKNRSGNAPRRTRSVEEHEENYRHSEQGWHGSAFEDVSPVKRRRF